MQYSIKVHRIVKQKKGANEYIEKHSHKFFHYIYGLGGTGKIIIDSQSVLAQKYSLIMIPPGTEHAIYGIDDFSSFDIKFSCDSILTEKLSKIGYCINEVSDYEDKLIKDVFDEAVCSDPLFEDIINIRILELVFRIMRRNKEGIHMTSNKQFIDNFLGDNNNKTIGKMREIINYIENNITQPIKITDLANLCGYSGSYFSTYFRECVGCTPSRYINLKKVELAKTMMMSTNLNVTQVSEALGFESVHYFSKVFKKIVGMPPITYHKRTNINMSINVIKDSTFTPVGQYEIPIKVINYKES